jgi:hypothetical protein
MWRSDRDLNGPAGVLATVCCEQGFLTGYPTAVMATMTPLGLWQLDRAEATGPSSGDPVLGSAPVDERVVEELAGLARGRGLVLELVDRGAGPERRSRFYSLHLQPALFGCVHVVRGWGRLGHRYRPRQLVTCHPTVESAHAALRPVVRRRLRRGYQLSAPGGP